MKHFRILIFGLLIGFILYSFIDSAIVFLLTGNEEFDQCPNQQAMVYQVIFFEDEIKCQL